MQGKSQSTTHQALQRLQLRGFRLYSVFNAVIEKTDVARKFRGRSRGLSSFWRVLLSRVNTSGRKQGRCRNHRNITTPGSLQSTVSTSVKLPQSDQLYFCSDPPKCSIDLIRTSHGQVPNALLNSISTSEKHFHNVRLSHVYRTWIQNSPPLVLGRTTKRLFLSRTALKRNVLFRNILCFVNTKQLHLKLTQIQIHFDEDSFFFWKTKVASARGTLICGCAHGGITTARQFLITQMNHLNFYFGKKPTNESRWCCSRQRNCCTLRPVPSLYLPHWCSWMSFGLIKLYAKELWVLRLHSNRHCCLKCMELLWDVQVSSVFSNFSSDVGFLANFFCFPFVVDVSEVGVVWPFLTLVCN